MVWCGKGPHLLHVLIHALGHEPLQHRVGLGQTHRHWTHNSAEHDHITTCQQQTQAHGDAATGHEPKHGLNMPPALILYGIVRASRPTCTLRLCVAEEGQGVAHLEQEGVTGTGHGGTLDQQLDQRTHSTTCA